MAGCCSSRLTEADRGRGGITAGVAVAAGTWIMWMIYTHPRWTERRWLMRVYFTGSLAFIAVLTLRSPWFAFRGWLGRGLPLGSGVCGQARWEKQAPGSAGRAIRLLAARGVSARVLVLTTFGTDTDVVPAIGAGATGYLLKDSPPDELLRGVQAAARGEAVLSPSVATRLLGQVREPAKEPLSHTHDGPFGINGLF